MVVQSKSPARVVTLAVIVDVIAVVAFATAGRLHHEEAANMAGVVSTSLPFLVGLAAGWITVLKALENAHPLAVFPTGIALWAWTMVGGVIIRLLSGEGAALAFVLTAALVTGALLIGWRGIAQLVLYFRRRASASASSEAV
ncbi:putative conserved transmembrane protein [Hoyosella subflava DQS3-9A1]|uniref:Putative conserved transmembrane protein n=1 Tax=Hoyosella subflava (strain DSM 45089 / JCM 17490 / NBRC 109087 / DQS3-9A1) TaxID=443218 RepID=F6EK38_HOYSD|nr:putative conserved transmembrane protein [Hoyosella subflava DQS3-9A1]